MYEIEPQSYETNWLQVAFSAKKLPEKFGFGVVYSKKLLEKLLEAEKTGLAEAANIKMLH